MEHPIPGYHSAVAYSLTDAEESDIVRVCSYHLMHYDSSVLWFSPRQHAAIRDQLSFASRESTPSIGKLEYFPLELLQQIILHLDMASVFRLRQASFTTRQLVESVPQFRKAIVHGLNAFCALMRTDLAARVSLSDFYLLLCDEQCAICRSFGNLVHLPTWTRCCSACLESQSPTLRMVSLTAVKRALKLSKQSLAKLPTFKNLPGIYTMEQRHYSGQVLLTPLESSIAAYRREKSVSDPPTETLNRLKSNPTWLYMSCCAISVYDPKSGDAQAGVSCAGCQLAVESDAIAGYTDRMRVFTYRDQVHSISAFLKHFAWCENAQKLWISSDYGSQIP